MFFFKFMAGLNVLPFQTYENTWRKNGVVTMMTSGCIQHPLFWFHMERGNVIQLQMFTVQMLPVQAWRVARIFSFWR